MLLKVLKRLKHEPQPTRFMLPSVYGNGQATKHSTPSVSQELLIMQQLAQDDLFKNPYEVIERERDFYKREYQYIRQLASNTSLDAADKWCLMLLRWKSHDTKKPLNEPQRMFYEEDAKQVGLSPKVVGQHYKKLAVSSIVERTLETESNGKKDVHKHISLAPSEAVVVQPAKVFHIEDRNHGGKRIAVMCKNCGTEVVNLKKMVQGTCPTCGEVHTYDLSKKEDKAFIVDADTAEHFEEWYGDVAPTSAPISLFPDKPSRDCIKCGSDCWIVNDGRWVNGCE